ncbi:hypothetical protein SLEP1_g37941 [Rubroshorea leprosula]|uniref:Uncharacterized protein n=1 Tax=Rubroshorea leprosula TaxID=152421 RepID=A0AAV5KX53_9ROSI|nr:hypothetical protein SLEP1_g37941 [Rubroshorea leprosula]
MGIPAGPDGAGKIPREILRGENAPHPRFTGRNIPPCPVPMTGILVGLRGDRGKLPSLPITIDGSHCMHI